MPSSTPLARMSLAALLLSVMLMLYALWLSAREVERMSEAGERRSHTYDVLAASAQALQHVTDAETASRGYAATGNDALRGSRSIADSESRAALDRLVTLVHDNPGQQGKAEELRRLALSRLEHSRRVEEAALRSPADGIAAIATGEGLELMQRYRLATASFEAREKALLAERSDLLEGATRSTRVALVWVGIGAAALIAAAIFIARRALAQLRAAEARARLDALRLAATFRSCGDALISTDTAGRILFVNPVAEALTGWREEEAVGLPSDQIFRIVNEHTRETVESPVGRVLREGKVIGLANHTLLIARDGTERPIDDSGAPIRDGDGETQGVILVFRDVSNRKVAEQARERLVRAEAEREIAVAANRAKDDFLAVMSHELRTPLAAMRGWLDLLVTGALPEEDVPGALRRIQRNARLQERLINDLLDVSRIRSGKLDVLRRPVNLAQIARAALTEIEPLASEKGVALVAELPSVPLFVKADEDRLTQVIQNLLSNAVKFTPRGGSARLGVAVVAEDRVRISVSDTGVGLGAEEIDRLFDPFWQAATLPGRRNGGLGLGLAISRHLVEEHGGSIHVESDGPGRGSVFHVDLPLPDIRSHHVALVAATAPSPSLAGSRILLVEDDGDTRLAIETCLRMAGAETSSVGSAEAALAALESAQYDIVVSDIGLPGANGFSLARHLTERSTAVSPRPALVAITGYTSVTERHAALASGFDAHVSKPVDLDELVRVALWLARKPAPSKP